MNDHRTTWPAALRRRWIAGTASSLLVAGGIAAVAGGGPAAAASRPAVPTCVTAGSTGLTAAVVLGSGGTLTGGTVNATGCDLGIYVGPGSVGVSITNETVTGANDHGIFAQDTTGLLISGSTVTGNGVAPTAGIAENKAIELVGATGALVTGNTVEANTADGGIGLADDGSFDPGAPAPGTLTASTADTISNNKSIGNYAGCGIVIAAYDPGAGISGITVSGNTVSGTIGAFGPHGPVIGGVVVAADTPHTSVSNVTVQSNDITGSFIPGIVVHSNAPFDTVSGVQLTSNTLSGDDWGSVDGPPRPAGIIVAASQIPAPVTPVLSGTTITGNTISQEFYGIWRAGDTSTAASSNTVNTFPGGTADFEVPAPGSGYWTAGSDGSVHAFGSALPHGSLAGTPLNAPVVGLAPTADQGGYWMAASDGGVFSFGAATYHGSLGGTHLNAPIVGIAATPYEAAPPGGQSNPAGKGYWLVGADGGVFAFGDAHYYGSMGGKHLNAPIVGMAPTSDGHGYWLVAKDGGVFTFGDATFHGSTGALRLNAPVVGMAPAPNNGGYWLVAADGGVFAFGSATFHGSMGGKHLNAPVTAIDATPSGMGYRLVARDGGVFDFGDATFYGSSGGAALTAPVVSASGVGPTVAA